jgi:hypothetical protein
MSGPVVRVYATKRFVARECFGSCLWEDLLDSQSGFDVFFLTILCVFDPLFKNVRFHGSAEGFAYAFFDGTRDVVCPAIFGGGAWPIFGAVDFWCLFFFGWCLRFCSSLV